MLGLKQSDTPRTALGEPGERIFRGLATSFFFFFFVLAVLRRVFFREFTAARALFDAFSRKARFAAASCLFVLPPCTRTTLRVLKDFFFLCIGEVPTVVIQELSLVCSCGGSIFVGVVFIILLA